VKVRSCADAGSAPVTHYDEQRRFFEDLAKRYDRRWLRARWPRNQQVKAAVIRAALGDAPSVGPVVEIGCGTAQIAEELLNADQQLEYVGLDLSTSMLEVARQRLARFVGRADLREVAGPLGLERGRYAAAFGVDVLHHVEDPTDVLREVSYGLRARSPIVFLEVNPRFPIATMVALLEKEERNVLKIGVSNLRHWFESAGLETVEVSYGPLYTPPGPPALVPLLDRIDAALARAPVVRRSAIFLVARGLVPFDRVEEPEVAG
jgi:SAM-dependent methyltransferase